MSDLGEYATVFKALSDPLRLRLLSMLPSNNDKRAFCVCELAQRLGVSQPCLSHHLSILRTAGLVGFEKDGCSAFYFVDQEQVVGKLNGFRERIQG
ncbi:MAG: helix-turn-helix transcriptional regulator [Candidatus Brocadiae bacterium]|nr:helix-turn-helix transcriptional regulator [Candidatus Brocadiia bacterium]